MDPILAAAVSGLVAVATDAAKETSTNLATAAWRKIKKVVGWTTDPPPAEIEAKAEEAIAEKPELASQVQQIVNDYRQQVGGVSIGKQGSIDLRGATVEAVKQASVGQNSGKINL